MRSDVLGDIPKLDALGLIKGYGFGLTFAVNRGPDQTGSIASRGEYFWGGAAGTTFWIDPEERMTGVWMMQTMNDLNTGVLFKQFAYQALEK
jgi:CubicO group peptidase (beta-lactamase class C family)